MSILGDYVNGNYYVRIYSDGTKIRENDLNFFEPAFPESFDIKITNQCDMGCPMCHEDSKPDGKHGDILHLPLMDSIHPYTELAIGGGNPLAHPDLVPFLRLCKDHDLIPNITVNKVHFMKAIPLLHDLTEQGLIYGLGVSFLGLEDDTPDFIREVSKFPNAVIHIINGIISENGFNALANHGLKILILGYKDFRRGAYNHNAHWREVEDKKIWLHDRLGDAIKNGEFKAISFDNIGLGQLSPGRFMTKEEWDEFYMGDDGRNGSFDSASMYIDAVDGKFAYNSCCPMRYDITGDIAEMFQFLRREYR